MGVTTLRVVVVVEVIFIILILVLKNAVKCEVVREKLKQKRNISVEISDMTVRGDGAADIHT